ncbi:serine/arginine repetitive matrix protein 2-like [Gymnodraco acuticeps]|uniref:Serine/arginine repetitive matrix protein 2-like n=1 Tax=Gymnodraco acuticeps TaxID=8218 RepID=A0A6P8VG07_GYMAC|nr:serine/arginine repetitive matrix protein 2-like [Gymnodraco acuticeps]
MKRCMVGTGSGPATWPDTSRLVEDIFILLCQLIPSSRTQWGFLRSRWTLVITAYDQVRATVYRCPALVARTTLQLFTVNQQTLSQWHKRWIAAQEKIILTSGIQALQAPRTAEEALLSETSIEEEEPQGEEPRAEEPLPGPGTLCKELRPPEEEEPFPATPSSSSSSSSAPSSSSSASYTPKSTNYNRLRLQKQQAEAAQRGESRRLRAPSQNKCSSCGLRKIKETGHRLLVKASGERVSYCPVLAKERSPEEWLESLQ